MQDNNLPQNANAAQNTQQQAQTADTQQQDAPVFRISYGTDYFQSGQFYSDISYYKAFAFRKTGFSSLDNIQPFYPGLYTLGGISSLGKTTFVHQLAENLAANKSPVLYFSLEQNPFELFSKSLSRSLYLAMKRDEKQRGCKSALHTFSSIQIRRGDAIGFPELADAVNDYTSRTGGYMYILDSSFCATVEDILEYTEAFMEQNKAKPLVVIDYLQIISPTMMGGRIPDTKTSIDHSVHTLKYMQNKHGLTVIVLSSLNRQNYMEPIDFESFKESGGIEYTADVVWGLQLALLNSDEFYYDTSTNGRKIERKLREKRQMIASAKSAETRSIQLVCLKNRYGCANYTADFDYIPKYDTFLSCSVKGPSPDL